MNCDQFQEQLADFLDIGSGVHTKPELRRHVDECAACRRQLERYEATIARLTPERVVASAGFQERVMNQLNTELEREAARPAKPSRWRILVPRLSFAVAAAAALVFTIPYIAQMGRRSTGGTASALLAQSVQALGRITSVHITARMRTIPGDNFETVGAGYDFVPVEIYRDFATPARWRIEKPGRVIVRDGTYTMLVFGNNALRHESPTAFGTWLAPLLDPAALFEAERRVTPLHPTEIQMTAGAPIVLSALHRTPDAAGNDWLRDKVIVASTHKRVYQFDPVTHLPSSLRISLQPEGGEEVSVFEVTSIEYDKAIDPSLFRIELPQGVEWESPDVAMASMPGASPASPREAALAFLEGLAAGDWDRVLSVYPHKRIDEQLKRVGGLRVVSVGEPFQSAFYVGWFVPYEIKFANGHTKKWNLAVRNDNPQQRWVYDGGF
jgi:outer membrane lipoprotein-sorting protein